MLQQMLLQKARAYKAARLGLADCVRKVPVHGV